MSAITTAMQGVTKSLARFDTAASRAASDAGGGGDILSDFVKQMEARQALSANISVVKASDAMTGRLLNIKA